MFFLLLFDNNHVNVIQYSNAYTLFCFVSSIFVVISHHLQMLIRNYSNVAVILSELVQIFLYIDAYLCHACFDLTRSLFATSFCSRVLFLFFFFCLFFLLLSYFVLSFSIIISSVQQNRDHYYQRYISSNIDAIMVLLYNYIID